MKLTASQLAADLGRRAEMMNAFGPTADGMALHEAQQCINSLRWLVSELADFTLGLVEALDDADGLDAETTDYWQELAAHAQGVIG